LEKEIGKRINIEINKDEIEKIHRVPTKVTSKPKPVIVQFLRRSTRDNFLTETKKQKIRITSTDLNLDSKNTMIYINDHLSINNKILLSESKKKIKQLNWKQAIFKNGKIIVKKDENHTPIVIRTLADLEELTDIRDGGNRGRRTET